MERKKRRIWRKERMKTSKRRSYSVTRSLSKRSILELEMMVERL
jgi:hypothetical protein